MLTINCNVKNEKMNIIYWKITKVMDYVEAEIADNMSRVLLIQKEDSRNYKIIQNSKNILLEKDTKLKE